MDFSEQYHIESEAWVALISRFRAKLKLDMIKRTTGKKRRLHELAGIWYIQLGNGWNISFHRMSALICLCYILTIIYCLKSSQVTAITISVLLLIYMFLVLFAILPQVCILPSFLRCSSVVFDWLINSSLISSVRLE